MPSSAAHAQAALRPGLQERAARRHRCRGDRGRRHTRIGIRIVDVHPVDAMDVADRGIAQVRIRAANDTRRLQAPAGFVAPRAAFRVLRQETIKTGMIRMVFRQVRDVRARIDGDGLVQHPSHVHDRPSGRLLRIFPDLEYVAVTPPAFRAQINDGLFASEPGAPGRHAARAVVDRAAKRRLGADPPAASKTERRRAACGGEDLPRRRRGVVTRGRKNRVCNRALVIAHEDDFALRAAATGRDHAHAVMRVGRRLAV